MSDWLGIDEHPVLFRALGLREVMAGVGILTNQKPAGWLWSRVAGDTMDIALLSAAMRSTDRPGSVLCAAAAVAGVTALDVMASQRMSQEARYINEEGMVETRQSITIAKGPQELYDYWRNFHNLPNFMQNLERIDVQSDTRSHWKVKAPAGMTVEWDAEVTEEIPGRRIAWKSVEPAEIENTGWVEFEQAPDGRGTVVRVQMEYKPPAGMLGHATAKMFGKAPDQDTMENLRCFKRLMETGELPTTEGQPSGRNMMESMKSMLPGRSE
jgi:uncharacterized membrane protein